MYAVNNISIHYAGRDVLSDVSFIINPKDRIGLTGKNGVGKSTLLGIIAGIKEPSKGNMIIPDDKTVGYLRQEIKLDSNLSVYQETLTAFAEVNRLEKEIEELTHFISHEPDHNSELYMQKISDLSDKSDRFNYLDGNKKESNVEKVLKGLGFSEEDLIRNINEFSGGWQMRVELAKLLLTKPDLLLLDEPTNHLDIESILWVEEILKNYNGAIVMVSHDRMFLDNITDRTIEIVFGTIYDYKLPYSKYLVAREERMETQLATFRNQQKYIEQQEQFINRFKAQATKAKQVQSKMKMLDKVERIKIDDSDTNAISFKFPPAPRSGNVVVDVKDLSKKYDQKLILNGVSFSLQRGEKVAFVGKNGEGKSTMSKIIVGLTDHTGAMTLGHNVNLGYYAQVQESTLNENQSVYEVIEREATGDWANMSRIRTLLGAFLFKEDDVDKKVKVLSGGEKSRLALARLLLTSYNLLVLDEPTNHLDISAKEILKQALKDYDGTLILVSHDRDFLQGLTSKTYEFANKKIKEHMGDINDFLLKHQAETFRDFESSPKAIAASQTISSTPELSNKEKYLLKKEQDKEIKRIQREVEKYEKEILRLETEIKLLSTVMHKDDFYDDPAKVSFTTQMHGKLVKQLEETMTAWEAITTDLEIKEIEI